MKRKFAIYILVSTVLATGTAGGIQVFGQSSRETNRQPNINPHSGQYLTTGTTLPTGSPVPLNFNGYNTPPGMLFPATGPQSYTSPYPAYPGGHGLPMQGMIGDGSPRYTVINKDGSIESIEKKPNAKFLKEDYDLINETRQTIEKAVSQLRSPDADGSKRKDSKELIAKYLKAEFQADQESRRNQVERLEKQVEQLKKQLSKRDESQDKLIELRLQLLENDASGLSFPESWGNLPGLPPMNSNLHTYSLNGGMQPSMPVQGYFNPVNPVMSNSLSPDVARPITPGLPTTQPSVQSRN